MPRVPRIITAGTCFHVINRGNAGARLFQGAHDYRSFLELVVKAQERKPLSLLAACLMPNHFHFVVMSRDIGDLGRWMHW